MQEFKDFYNYNKNTFSINDSILYNIISDRRKSTYRFKKESALYNNRDYKNRLFLREFINQNIYIDSKKQFVNFMYIIWDNDENIARICISNNY